MDNIVCGVLYYPCLMVLGQFFCRFTGSAAQTHCARRPQLGQQEIFGGRNFHELAFDRENCETFCLRGFRVRVLPRNRHETPSVHTAIEMLSGKPSLVTAVGRV